MMWYTWFAFRFCWMFPCTLHWVACRNHGRRELCAIKVWRRSGICKKITAASQNPPSPHEIAALLEEDDYFISTLWEHILPHNQGRHILKDSPQLCHIKQNGEFNYRFNCLKKSSAWWASPSVQFWRHVIFSGTHSHADGDHCSLDCPSYSDT